MTIQYMHNKDQIHRELKKVSNYVILGDDVMIFNIKSGNDGHTQRFQDLSDLGEFITDKFPLTISEFSRLKCYFDFHQSKKHKTRLNGPCFDTKIRGLDFEEFRNWDTKIVIDGYLDNVEDLIRVIRNVYVHYVKDEELDKINEKINTCFPGLLSRIHATLRIKKVEEIL
ncbi:hypothetical protein ACFX2I_015435 [Malus domestica]